MARPRAAIHVVVLVDAPAVEEHDGDVDAALAGGEDAGAEALEIAGVEAVESEARFVVEGVAGAGALEGHGIEVESAEGFHGPPGFFPAPEAEEVVVVAGQKVEVEVIVEGVGGVGAVGFLEVVPGVGAGEEDGAAGGVGEVAGVGGVDAQGLEMGGVGMAGLRSRTGVMLCEVFQAAMVQRYGSQQTFALDRSYTDLYLGRSQMQS